MGLYRKKPVEIEAWQWNGESQGAMRGVCQCEINRVAHLHTAHQGQIVFLQKGDWIIPEKEAGRFYPCKPHIFAETYEPVLDYEALEKNRLAIEENRRARALMDAPD
jgi:hypothetical protein